MADDWQNCLLSHASCFSALQKHRDKILPDSVVRWFSFRCVCTFGCASLLMDVCTKLHPCCLCAQSFSKGSFCLHWNWQGKKEKKEYLPAWHRSCQEEFCVYPVACVSEEPAQLLANVNCVWATCSRKQNGL